MQKSSIDMGVGFLVIAGFAALLALALKVGNLSGERNEQSYKVNVRFSNIGGLKAQAPVKASGVLVGRVTAIEFDTKTYQANVHLALFNRIPFPKDTSASILTSGLLGEVYVGLEAGEDGTMLKEGDRITIAQSAVVLEKLISQFLFQKASDGPTANGAANGVATTTEPPKK